MAQRPAASTDHSGMVKVALGGVIIALLVLLLATLVRVPLHPPYYDTISAVSGGQVEGP